MFPDKIVVLADLLTHDTIFGGRALKKHFTFILFLLKHFTFILFLLLSTTSITMAEIPSIMYIDSPVAPEFPVWASSRAVFDDMSLLRSTSGMEYYFSLPVEPETGCSVFDEAWDAFGSIPRNPHTVVRVRIVEATPGFGHGLPGTLFRSELISVLKGEKKSSQREFYFFAATGEFDFGEYKICVRDSRFPDLQLADEAILYIRFSYPEQRFVEVGDGGVLGMRNGEVLKKGDLYRRLGRPETVEQVESNLRGALSP